MVNGEYSIIIVKKKAAHGEQQSKPTAVRACL